jgi:hypothetical protein
MSRFLDRANLGFRKTRTTKHSMINDKACLHFLAQLTTLQAEYAAECILSFDESSWRLVIVPERPVAERGAEVIP